MSGANKRQRLIRRLRVQGWTDKKIMDFVYWGKGRLTPAIEEAKDSE